MLNIGTAGSIQKVKDQWSLFDTDFNVHARGQGFSLEISWITLDVLDVLDWIGRIRILRKTDEWPLSWDDPDATLIVDQTYTTPTSNTIIQDDLVEGKIYYYTLFMQRTDEYWIEDKVNNRRSAYPYGRWGHADYLFGSFPKGWQIDDSLGTGDLLGISTIFGALFDNMKTDTENLLSLCSVDDIHTDLLWMLDDKIKWPTWDQIGAVQQRKESLAAVDNYKLFGTEPGYESILSQTSGWDVEIWEGWRWTMFSNGKFGCTTPDTTDTQLIPSIGTFPNNTDPLLATDPGDRLRYTNDTLEWHSVNGIAVEAVDIPGISEELTEAIIARWYDLLEFSRASYVNYQLVIDPQIIEETPGLPIDSWEDS